MGLLVQGQELRPLTAGGGRPASSAVYRSPRHYPGLVVSAIPAEVILARLAHDDRRAVVEFRDELRRMLGPRLRDLRLYGSKVRGDDHEESDIDVLVLLDAKDWPTWEAIVDLASSISTSTWISPRVIAFDDYHAPSSRATGFYKELRRESVKLL